MLPEPLAPTRVLLIRSNRSDNEACVANHVSSSGTLALRRAGRECTVIAIPIPPHELKSGTWYYGVHCACTRLHALCEDLFGGKTAEQHLDCSNPIEVACECGVVTRTKRLYKFKTQ
jgi:hypothetical protein